MKSHGQSLFSSAFWLLSLATHRVISAFQESVGICSGDLVTFCDISNIHISQLSAIMGIHVLFILQWHTYHTISHFPRFTVNVLDKTRYWIFNLWIRSIPKIVRGWWFPRANFTHSPCHTLLLLVTRGKPLSVSRPCEGLLPHTDPSLVSCIQPEWRENGHVSEEPYGITSSV